MTVNQSDMKASPTYKFYFDDIEELFFNSMPFQALLLSTIIACLLTLVSVIFLISRSRTIFLACLIPLIYALIFYDVLQLISINLLNYHFHHFNEQMFSLFCRWPYYFKALAESGQCLTLIFFYAIRCQKVRYFYKHKYMPNSSPIHTRALTFVCFLFILYAHNWITHLKVDKIHLITLNESQYEINIQEYPLPLYGKNDVKLNDRQRFYADFDRYARNSKRNPTLTNQSERIIHRQKGDSVQEIIIKIPYNNFFIQRNRTRSKNLLRRKFSNRTQKKNSKSYRIHRCTYGQRNFLLINLWSLIHSIFYLLLLLYYLSSIYRYPIPNMNIDYQRKLYDHAMAIGRRKSAERHKQSILLTHLRYFQYLIVYCHTVFILIRLMYTCLLTIILCLSHSPFQWSWLRWLFYILFLIVYYSIPLRLICLFVYLFGSLFSSTIYSIFYYIFHTKLHFSCQLQRPSIRFQLHIVPYEQSFIPPDEHSSNSFVLDLTSSIYDEHSTIYPNESMGIYEENSSGIHVGTNHALVIANELEQSQL